MKDIINARWHQTENEGQTRPLKTHCFVTKHFTHPYDFSEKIEGNISLCGQIMISEGNEPNQRIKLEDIEPHFLAQRKACKVCMKLYLAEILVK